MKLSFNLYVFLFSVWHTIYSTIIVCGEFITVFRYNTITLQRNCVVTVIDIISTNCQVIWYFVVVIFSIEVIPCRIL